ncbi:hypothetical protein PJV93_06085 [Aliarcobacter butzleri]|uniref:ATPase AAA-type core domain-containing protein n=1 Tax=Aliarcobacter butzleri TaxID=28197 RepID=A0AAW7QC06_9BACT|nr:hypothetical protein [Aliarcobacter butzleri]MDN5106756.1 hypothetical protein [Aliarcobacter butzleri]MDN5123478.1 hypothetical protein [Aliarcobacter butzleri]
MRLLFIYFYKDFGTFEKGSIIHLSKKYKFTLDKEKSTEKEFYFNKEENLNFIEDFYSKNIDIGVLIGENGTGKSVLLNSIRDKKNEYSICVYENDEFYLLENDLSKIEKNELYNKNNIPFNEDEKFVIKINDKNISKRRKFKSIYYSSILEKINQNLNDDFDVSNMYLLNEMKNNSLEKKLELLEISDLHKMNNFNYKIELNISKTFFEDAKEFIKDSYILLFEKTMEILNENKDYEKIEKVFNKLPDFILNDIVKYHLEEKEIFLNELKDDENVINEYLNIYKNSIYDYFKNNKTDLDKELVNIYKRTKEVEDKFFDDNFFNELFKIDFDLKTIKIKDILENVRKLFKIEYRPYRTNGFEDNSKHMLMYFGLEKAFEICLSKLKLKNKKVDKIKKVFDIYKVYYLRQEMSYVPYILIDLFNKGKYGDILLIERKVVHHQFLETNEKFIDYKEETINEIKKIIENDYSLFYESLINNLKNLDDKILILLILKKLENFEKLEKEKDVTLAVNEAVYTYLSKLLKIKKLDLDEKIELQKIFSKKEDIKTQLIINYHKFKEYEVYENQKIEDFNIDDYRKFVKDGINPFSFTFNPPISSGQKAKEIINARINDSIKKINQKNLNENILILLDEADLKLHLEWQRVFISDLIIKFLKKDYPNNKFYVLYATHSPMILSDITNDRVVFLKKKDDKYSEDKQDFSKSTFGANIYDIYADSFFVDDFMGKFAQNKINEVIKIIEKNKKISDKKASSLLKVIKNIGEPLLRNKLEDEIKSLSELEIKDDISIIADKLRDKNFEEIKQELNKYSQEKQRQILEKLFGNQND